MSIPGAGNPLLLGGAAGGYEIERSLRFNSPDSAYLSRTPASAGNRKTWTWAGWVKRSVLGARQGLFTVYTSSFLGLEFSASDTIIVYDTAATTTYISRQTTAVYRDTSAWYHVVLAYDTTQATAANRVKLYVNGVEVTAFQTTDNPAQNADTSVNLAFIHGIGGWIDVGQALFFGGYLADVHFIDGQALDPSSFGEFDTNGIWQPKAYAGTYGTNGFQLKFADNSNNTATTLGKDTSPNGNNWTPNNLSVTAGAGNDSLTDTPTSYGTDTGAGGEVRGNYCTWNPLTVTSPLALANGNLDITDNTGSAPVALGTIAVNSGKWYWEVTIGNTFCYIGAAKVTSRSSVGFLGSAAGQFMYNNSSAAASYIDGAAYNYSTGSTSTTNDVIGVALNFDSNQITFYKNGVSMGVFGSNILGTDLWAPAFKTNAGTSATFNFGQRPFAYTAPSGFKALCTQNLPSPTVTKSSSVMDVLLWTGNGSARSITGLGFNPDLVWIKGRSGATDHALYDAVRGAQARLESNNSDAEVTSDGGLTAFNSDGFSLGTLAQVNTNAATYVAWTWDAGSSTVTNTDGTISSQVRANASAGFSVLTYTGATNSSTIGHGLGVAPSLIITKSRGGAGQWVIYHAALGFNYYGGFSTAAFANNSAAWKTSPTSSVYTIGSAAEAPILNTTGETYVSYCFAPVAGYSAFGSYTGNGSADGPFVYTGFRPRWVMFRSTSGTRDWMIKDALRSTPSNPQDGNLYANSALAEDVTSTVYIDLLSNGFKIRGTYSSINASTETFVYAAFAESPFALARAR